MEKKPYYTPWHPYKVIGKHTRSDVQDYYHRFTDTNSRLSHLSFGGCCIIMQYFSSERFQMCIASSCSTAVFSSKRFPLCW
jgi:hypothetical protein